MTVVRIDRMPTGIEDGDAAWQENPDAEYAPEFLQIRDDLKPLDIV